MDWWVCNTMTLRHLLKYNICHFLDDTIYLFIRAYIVVFLGSSD